MSYPKAYTVAELREQVRPYGEPSEWDVPGPFPVIIVDDEHNAREFTEAEFLGLCLTLWVSENNKAEAPPGHSSPEGPQAAAPAVGTQGGLVP
jgi:hypothetical protein